MPFAYPVEEILLQLKTSLEHSSVVILQAPPGAGKSTILPLKLLQEPWLKDRKIIMLEPRRLAARSVAHRMAQLRQENVGESIGYRVRFENVVSKHTRCEVVTEGILTRMMQVDNALEDVGLVIFDEFHERNLQADLALALCLQIQQVLRDDLRILIMSATLEGEKISTLLDGAPIITATGRQHPVSIHYTTPDKSTSIANATAKIILKALREQSGDILAFLPGTGDIHRAVTALSAQPIAAGIYPLYGDLPLTKQQEAITPNDRGERKIVLSTAIAETSLTIDGITTVVDSGYARVPKFDPRSGLTRLETVRVTRDAADQRAGRAGRLGPGVCYRIWPEKTNHLLQSSRQPEILEADLAPLMLELAHWGANIDQLTWITRPPAGAVSQALSLLGQLIAIDGTNITPHGKEMLQLPTHPRIAHMLLEGKENSALATDIAALLEERDPVAQTSGTDLSLRVEALRKWRSGERVDADRTALERIERIASLLRRQLNATVDNAFAADTQVGMLLANVYPERVARQLEPQGIRYKLANGRIARLPEHDPLLQYPFIAIAQISSGQGEGKIFMAAPLDEKDLLHRATDNDVVRWSQDRGAIIASSEKRVGSVVLSSTPLLKIPEDVRINVLCEALHEEGLSLLNWSGVHDSWRARVSSLKLWRTEEPWPEISDEYLIRTAPIWLAPYLTDVVKRQDLQKLDLTSILMGILPWELSSKLDQLAPTKLSVPSGSMIKLQYSATGEPPVMAVRLQETFGLLQTPSVNEGRNKVVMHLLSPGFKIVQVTQDLKSFWDNAYHDVRKQMRMRYPRHHWPEDPWTAEAVRGAKKKKS